MRALHEPLQVQWEVFAEDRERLPLNENSQGADSRARCEHSTALYLATPREEPSRQVTSSSVGQGPANHVPSGTNMVSKR